MCPSNHRNRYWNCIDYWLVRSSKLHLTYTWSPKWCTNTFSIDFEMMMCAVGSKSSKGLGRRYLVLKSWFFLGLASQVKFTGPLFCNSCPTSQRIKRFRLSRSHWWHCGFEEFRWWSSFFLRNKSPLSKNRKENFRWAVDNFSGNFLLLLFYFDWGIRSKIPVEMCCE